MIANYEVLIRKDGANLWSPEDLDIIPGNSMQLTYEDGFIADRIEQVWDAKYKAALVKGKSLFSGPQYRLSGFEATPTTLVLALGLTNYREFIGTNVEAGLDPEWMQRLMLLGSHRFGNRHAYFSDALAVCGAIETGDGLVIVGLRSDKVAEYPRCWHTVGGHPDPRDLNSRENPIFSGMISEVCKELGVGKNEISKIYAVALVRNTWTLKPEMIFTIKVKPTFAEIQSRRGEERDEHLKFFGVKPDDLAGFIHANQAIFSMPQGHGLNVNEIVSLAPPGHPANTSNFFVPPGEAAFKFYLKARTRL